MRVHVHVWHVVRACVHARAPRPICQTYEMEENTHFQTRSAQRQICSRFCLSEPVNYCRRYMDFYKEGEEPSAYLDEDFLETRINDLLMQFVAVERQALHELLHRALRLEREQR